MPMQSFITAFCCGSRVWPCPLGTCRKALLNKTSNSRYSPKISQWWPPTGGAAGGLH